MIQIVQYDENILSSETNDSNIKSVYEKFEFSGNIQVLNLNSDIR